MTGRQRIQAALAGKFADTTPIMLHNFLLAVKEAGVTHAQYRNDPQVIARTHIQAVETYGYDGILVDIDTCTLAGALGVPVDFPEDLPARCHEPALTAIEQVDDLPEKPDIAAYKYVQVWLESVRLLRRHFGGEKYIRGNCDQAAFSLATMMRTPSEFMVDLLDEENAPRVERLLSYCCDAVCQFIGLMAQTGADMVSNGDSPAGPAMISPAMYRRFALPWEKHIVETAHKAGMPYMLHICGDTEPILDAMLESGADALELDYKTDMQKIHDEMSLRALFCGNLDPSGVLARGTPALVGAETRRLLTLFRDVPRFVLNAGCAIPAETPPENLRTMIRTAREFVR
jgi:MtaA/CmuA family methyltransferase